MFPGKELVELLVDTGVAKDVTDALAIGNAFLRESGCPPFSGLGAWPAMCAVGPGAGSRGSPPEVGGGRQVLPSNQGGVFSLVPPPPPPPLPFLAPRFTGYAPPFRWLEPRGAGNTQPSSGVSGGGSEGGGTVLDIPPLRTPRGTRRGDCREVWGLQWLVPGLACWLTSKLGWNSRSFRASASSRRGRRRQSDARVRGPGASGRAGPSSANRTPWFEPMGTRHNPCVVPLGPDPPLLWPGAAKRMMPAAIPGCTVPAWLRGSEPRVPSVMGALSTERRSIRGRHSVTIIRSSRVFPDEPLH